MPLDGKSIIAKGATPPGVPRSSAPADGSHAASVIAVGVPVHALARRVDVDRYASHGKARELRIEAADDERHLPAFRVPAGRAGRHLDLDHPRDRRGWQP